jgi:molybdopterin-guanine dinucleotide biosynthesis protein A
LGSLFRGRDLPAGWVLAGGQSRRMGTDKARLELSGIPMALLVADEISKVCCRVSLVGEPERYAGLGLPVIPDRFPGAGPLAGIEAALSATESEWNLIVACDMPALDSVALSELIDAAAPNVDAVVPVRIRDGSERKEPLCALYRRSCAGGIRRLLESGFRRATEALDSFEVRYVRVAHPDRFANLNTPDDLTRYRNG